MMYGGTKKKVKKGSGGMKYMKAGGAKPDYLDMDGDGNKTESMKSAVASKKKMKLGGSKEMKDLKASQKEMRKGMRMARKEQRGQDREERKDIRAEKRSKKKLTKKAVRRIKKAVKGIGAAKVMGAGGMKKHQTGGFLEMPTFDLDRD